MPNVLISGPAGGGKSQLARTLLREATEPAVQADFQSVVVSLLGLERGPDGKYPIRPSWVLGLAEQIRQAIIDGANERELAIIATNSDGSPDRRESLLARLGPGSVERIVDPGYDVVRARLADAQFLGQPAELSDDCARAIDRWFGRI